MDIDLEIPRLHNETTGFLERVLALMDPELFNEGEKWFYKNE